MPWFRWFCQAKYDYARALIDSGDRVLTTDALVLLQGNSRARVHNPCIPPPFVLVFVSPVHACGAPAFQNLFTVATSRACACLPWHLRTTASGRCRKAGRRLSTSWGESLTTRMLWCFIACFEHRLAEVCIAAAVAMVQAALGCALCAGVLC